MTPKSPVSIALVDDHITTRKFISNNLSFAGLSIACEVGNGQELLDHLVEADTIPDLCLLDINMPVMDGYETASILKDNYPYIKILAYSFYDDQERIEKITQCGAHGFIAKDCSASELKNTLLSLLDDAPKSC